MNFAKAYPDRCTTVSCVVGSAAKAGDAEGLRNLIAQGCCVHSLADMDNRGWFPLHEAAAAGNVDCLKILLNHEEPEVDSQTFEGETALYLACTASAEHAEAVEELLKAGAIPDLANNNDDTPLFRASYLHEGCVQLLLEYEANVNCICYNGWTPLHVAAYGGHLGILKKLLKAGSLVNASDNYNVTPIYTAAQYGQAESLKILVDSGGNVNTQDEEGDTALYIAAQEGHTDCIRYLLDSGADPNILDVDGCKPVHVAAETNQLEALELLLPVSQMEYSPGASRWSPLHCTTVNGNIEAARLILDHGCDVNTGFIHSNNYPTLPRSILIVMSPLCHSFYRGRGTALFDFLLSKGANFRCEWEYPEGCYFFEIFNRKKGRNNVKAMRKLVTSGLQINCLCTVQFFFHLNVHSNRQLQLYKFMLACGLKPRLHCHRLCLCSRDYGPLNRRFIQKSLSLAILYIRTSVASLCPASVGILKDSAYWSQIRKLIEEPASLQHLCRLAIREILRSKGLHRMQEFVSEMVITNIMKSYLLYKDDLFQRIIKT